MFTVLLIIFFIVIFGTGIKSRRGGGGSFELRTDVCIQNPFIPYETWLEYHRKQCHHPERHS